jgi:hypothetical protein
MHSDHRGSGGIFRAAHALQRGAPPTFFQRG